MDDTEAVVEATEGIARLAIVGTGVTRVMAPREQGVQAAEVGAAAAEGPGLAGHQTAASLALSHQQPDCLCLFQGKICHTP